MKKKVKKIYRQIVKRADACLPVEAGLLAKTGLPNSSCCTGDTSLYEQLLADLPPEMRRMSWGCGSPLAIDIFQPGDIVADIGCGAGLDVLLAAKKVGSKGKAIGIDFTKEMLQKARQNAVKAKLSNTEFLNGEAERLPLDDNFISVVTSNCVLNLVPDKKAVFKEIVRVLKPGGRLVVADIVSERELPENLKRNPLLWSSCIGGAIPEKEYLNLMRLVGLRGIVIFARQPIRTCDVELYSITLQAVKPDIKTRYSFPSLIHYNNNGTHLFLTPELPAWFSTNKIGAEIILACDGKTSIRSLAQKVAKHRKDLNLDSVVDFLTELDSRGIALYHQSKNKAFPGRSKALLPKHLEEIWLHTNNSCNSRCRHCLVSAGKNGESQLSLNDVLKIVDQSQTLGAKRFYITGGEPFLRSDIFDIINSILPQSSLVLLTNGTLLTRHRSKLGKLNPNGRLLFQVSLEGPNATVHDAIRGSGNFEAALSGIKTLLDLGFLPVIATTLTSLNAQYMTETARFLHRLGIKHHHILWLHDRGRGAQNLELTVSPQKMIETMRELQQVSDELGIVIDNYKATSSRVVGRQGRKYDLCHAAYSTLAIGPDGQTYPCAAFIGDSRFTCGSIREQALAEIWEKSPYLNKIRQQSLIDQAECRDCPIKFLCGGGCLSHKYFASGKLSYLDPYCQVYKAMFNDVLWKLATPDRQGKSFSGEDAQPEIYAAVMPPYNPTGCQFDVAAFHCACVLTTESTTNGCS